MLVDAPSASGEGPRVDERVHERVGDITPVKEEPAEVEPEVKVEPEELATSNSQGHIQKGKRKAAKVPPSDRYLRS